ncbi:craniofacial development protein 2-like [Acyrthosiphon pisum]|uniref:Endonuclease/exonuclease/phosphatase domain-containing protein n=1 Tax=Acyrthosiphon pisum TaxID=7029 RepID=A0A8R2B1P0_ACYPI|nr:craniofacial development protein 2-like [Acyrthosiphon pisum]|eukprot:XP_008179458.1 PREDICTED: craniofacial development protein 2-like [Acyrthosiphon pisum]
MDKQLEQGNGINLGSWNVRTLNIPGALQYVLDTVRSYKIQLLALQEVRWPNKGSVTKENMTLFYSETDNGARENGVVFIVHDCLLPHVKIFEPVNDRICYIILKGKYFDIAVISCYGPTEEKEDKKKDKFYEELAEVYDRLPRHSIKIFLGNFNAKIGRETMYRPLIGKESHHEYSNDNGTRLINMAMSKELGISSTYFPRKNIHKHTWVSPNELTKNQIDHVMISKKHMSCISNVRSYRGADADTDHYLIIAHFRIRLSSKWKRSSKTYNSKFNVEILRDQEIAKQYEKLVQKKIGKNSWKNSTEDIENQWNRKKQIITDCASVVIGNAPKREEKRWFNDKCREAIKKRFELRKKLLQNPSEENKIIYENWRKETHKLLRREKRTDMKARIAEIEENRKNPKKFFENRKQIKEGFKPQVKMLLNEKGELVTDKKEIVELFKKHFETLLNRQGQGSTNEDMTYYTVEPDIGEPK